METLIVFCLLGLGTGAMYAALAIGVIVVHRGTGVVNFALGAQAMFPAIVFTELRTSGDLILPVIVIPNRYDIGGAMGLWPAFIIALAIGAVVSAVGYLVVFRPLREAAPLTLIVATVGFSIVLQGLAVKAFGTTTVRTPEILPSGSVEVFDRPIPLDRFWLAGVVVVIALALALVYRVTRFGLATRASAANEKGTILLGYNPVALGVINWVVASVLVSTIGVLITPLSGVNPFNYSLFVIPALGAALAGRLRSMGKATMAALLIGSFQAYTVHLVSQRKVPDFFLGGLDSVVPFVVIVGALVLAGNTLPTRGTFLNRHHVYAPRSNLNPWLWTITLAAGLTIALMGDSPTRFGLMQSMFVTCVLLSIVVITGYVGQMSLAQLALAGFSAFMLSRFNQGMGIPFPAAPILAIGVTTVVGVLIGIPALRIRGIQFAIVTYSAALVFERLIFRSPTFAGPGGLASVDQPAIAGLELGTFAGGEFPSRRFTVGTVLVTALLCLLVARVRTSAIGRRFLAVRINERAAAASGINIARQKLAGAAFASAIAATGGVIFAYKASDFTSASFEPDEGLQFVALAFLGGVGAIAGAVIGGLLAPSGLLIVTLSSGAPSANLFLATGVGLLLVTTLFPSGVAGILSQLGRALTRRGQAPESPPTDLSRR